MTTEIKIKAYDLHAIIKDLITEALGIDRPNILKICSFVQNLVDNGGHKTKAARDAGYGPEKTKDGEIRSEENRNSIASAEGSRLLGDARISAVYERLLSDRILAETFTKSLSKNHIKNIMYQLGMANIYKDDLKQALIAFKEVSTLCGHYDSATNKEPANETPLEREEMSENGRLLRQMNNELRKQQKMREDAAMKPAISSEVYN